jgi:hypothetical protein
VKRGGNWKERREKWWWGDGVLRKKGQRERMSRGGVTGGQNLGNCYEGLRGVMGLKKLEIEEEG